MSEEAHDDRASSGSTCKGWKAEELTHLVERIDYGHTASAVDAPSGPRFLRITDIQDEHVDWSSVPSCEIASREIDQYRLSPGDIVFARTGATTGKSYLIQKCPEAVFASYLIRLRLRPGILPAYLFHFFKSADYWGQINQKKKGTGQPGVNSTILATLRVPIAPANEQSRIVEALDSYLTRLDAATEGLKRVEANLKRYRASVLKAAVEGNLVPTEAELAKKEKREYEPASVLLERILKERRHRWEQAELAKMKAKGEVPKNDKWKDKYEEPSAPDTSDLPELPEGWCWATVEQLASDEPRSIQSGPFGSSLLHSEFRPAGKLVVGIDNVQDGYFSMGSENRISEEKFSSLAKYLARPGDVLVTVMATIGRTCVVPTGLEPAIITKHVYRITSDSALVTPRCLHLALWGAPKVREQMFGQVQGQTRPGLNGEILRRLCIPLPAREEQDRIVAAVESGLSKVDTLRAMVGKGLKHIARLRQSILRWAFEGKLVDRDPDDEPASVLLERIRRERESSRQVKTPKPGRTGESTGTSHIGHLGARRKLWD
jgi:type I restriction enzyme S subunit